MNNNKDSIRCYNGHVFLNFRYSGSNSMLNLTDNPHYQKWRNIIGFLKRRGFTITENETYKKHYSCLSDNHKIGFKNGVALLMEITNISINVEFGSVKNLWKGMQQSFWDDPKDERYTQLTYLESMAVKLEIYKLLRFYDKYKIPLDVDDRKLSAEQYIIHQLKVNTHIHGKVECLNDIKLSITESSYDWQCNSNDRDKKKIICGETKYFYDYRTKRIACGVVWHHINNMWWVICGGSLRNISSYELFDYSPDLPRKRPTEKELILRVLKKHESQMDYIKCAAIKNYYNRRYPLSPIGVAFPA